MKRPNADSEKPDTNTPSDTSLKASKPDETPSPPRNVAALFESSPSARSVLYDPHLPFDNDDDSPPLPTPAKDKFESSEHYIIGQVAFSELLQNATYRNLTTQLSACKLYYAQGKINNQTRQHVFHLADDIDLTPGEMIALAGDYYGVADKPISLGVELEERMLRFKEAMDSLLTETRWKLTSLLTKLYDEYNEVQDCIRKGLKPKLAFSAKHKGLGAKIFSVLSSVVHLPTTFLYGYRTAALALTNFDHFGDQAKLAYEAGHSLALEIARSVQDEPDDQKRCELVVLAIAYELFADHFLTDSFSAGHIRTPRVAILQNLVGADADIMTASLGQKTVAGLLAKAMHDEDNNNGLTVENGDDDNITTWEAFGDKCYLEYENQDNRRQVINLVKQGLTEVFNSCLYGATNANNSTYALMIPRLSPEETSQPLFNEQGMVRRNINDITCSEYVPVTSPKKLCYQLFTRDKDASLTESERNQLLEELDAIENLNEDDEIDLNGPDGTLNGCIIC